MKKPKRRRSKQTQAVEVDGVRAWIYPTPSRGRPGWTVCYRFGGRRLRRWFASRGSAEEHAREQARKIASGKTASLALPAERAAAYMRADELLAPTGQPIELVAAQFIADWRKRLGAGGSRGVADVVDEFLAAKEKAVQARWRDALEHMLGRFKQAFRVPLAAVRAADLQAWLDALGLGARSKLNHRDAVRSLFRFARRRKYLAHDHDEVSSLELPDAPAGRIQPYAPEEMQRILEHAASKAPRFVPYLAVRGFSGVRYEETSRLPVGAVHLPTGWIALDAQLTKTARRRLIPILPALRSWWRAFPPPGAAVAPYPSATMGPRLVEIIRAAGVQNRHNGLRDSFATYRMAAVQNAAQVAQECGNSPRMIEASYREVRLLDGRVVTPKLAAAWFASRAQRPRNVVRLVQGA